MLLEVGSAYFCLQRRKGSALPRPSSQLVHSPNPKEAAQFTFARLETPHLLSKEKKNNKKNKL